MNAGKSLVVLFAGAGLAGVAALSALGCASADRALAGDGDGGTSRGAVETAFADASAINANGGDASPGKTKCPVETQFVHLIDRDGTLYRFDPTSTTFSNTGKITCPGAVHSMAVDRNAFAWVHFSDGRIMKVDTRNASCTPTAFVPNQKGFATNFGMGFSSNSADSDDETLFVSDGMSPVLATIDTNTLDLTKIGTYDKISARGELTGTGDARLFGAFEGTPYNVAEIDKKSAGIKSEAPQTAVNYPPSSSNFAFAHWGGDFFLFVGPGDRTDVFRYSPASGQTAKVQSVSFVIVGAGVSTCAPTAPPK